MVRIYIIIELSTRSFFCNFVVSCYKKKMHAIIVLNMPYKCMSFINAFVSMSLCQWDQLICYLPCNLESCQNLKRIQLYCIHIQEEHKTFSYFEQSTDGVTRQQKLTENNRLSLIKHRISIHSMYMYFNVQFLMGNKPLLREIIF